jgi:IS30 family transposase
MPNSDKMTIDERYKYLRIRQKKYSKAVRLERSRMLDEMEQVTGLDRKTLIRHMRGKIERKARQRQRGKVYGSAVDDALRVISESHDHICAERLTPNLVAMAQHLAAHHEMALNRALEEQLARISVSTVKRKLRCFARLDQWRLPRRRGPKPPNPVTRDIPMGRIAWNESEPGHFEADLVHHCGSSLCGDYVCTVQLTDVATNWCEQAAVLGHSQRVMQAAFEHILARLPFSVREIHPDNGSEFFNHHLLRFWKDAVPGVHLSRSRPFHKNDNRFVEQKNFTLVRAYLGHGRFDTVAQTCLLNQLYDKMWLYYNFLQPVMRVVEKTAVPDANQGWRIKRRYDRPQTPFERLCASGVLPAHQRHTLQGLRDSTNPRRLRDDIWALLDRLSSLPNAKYPQNVLHTLTLPTQKGAASPVTFSVELTTTP